MEQDKKKLFDILKKNAFFREKITLSSGKQSDYYLDARRVTLSPQGAYLCAKIILAMIQDDCVDAIGGPTLGADSIVGAVAALSFEAQKPVNAFIVRKAPKPYGKQQQVEGPLLEKNMNVVLFDDVATTGKSIIESLEVLKKMGIMAKKAICIVDREEGAREALRAVDCELVSIFTAREFLK